MKENVDEEARYEEARLAEETMNTNLKLMRKQKLRFIRLQKILSRNIILIPLCVIFSIISAATIFSSTLTDYYEIFTYDEDKLRHNIELENNSTLLHIQQYLHDVNKSIDLFLKPKRTHNGNLLSYSLHSNDSNTKLTNFMLVKRDLDHRKKLYEDNILGGILIDPENDLSIQAEEISASLIPSATLHYQSLPNELKKAYVYELIRHSDYLMLYRRNFFVRDNLYMKKNAIFTTHSGMWRQCNYLSEKSRRELQIEKCSFYKNKNISEVLVIDYDNGVHEKDPARDLIRMHNAAVCCIIVSYFLLFTSWATGIAAAFTKQVPITLATGVLKLCICVFLVFLLGIVHRKMYSEEKQHECYDLRIDMTIVCSARKLTYGYSLGLVWLATISTTLSCVCWFQITKMQKLLFTNGYY